MLILGIFWPGSWVQITTGTGKYTCPMEERDDDFYFHFKGQSPLKYDLLIKHSNCIRSGNPQCC